MRKVILTAASAIAVAGFAAPAMAHPDDGHDEEHEQLNDQHDEAHDDLDYEHAEAHAQGLSPWEHYQLHRYLDAKHDWEHEQLRSEHHRWHNYNDWDYGAYNGYPRYYGYRHYYPRSYSRSGVYFQFGW